MGFFDKLKDLWLDGDSWKTDWSKVGSDFAKAGKAAFGSLLSSMAAQWNLVGSLTDSSISTRAALANYMGDLRKDTGPKAAEALGSFGSAVSNVSGVRQVLGTADWLQTELVKRPLSTVNLVNADVTINRENPLAPLALWDPATRERWKKAYNTTTYVTPGQAWFYNFVAGTQFQVDLFTDMPTDLQRRDILREFPTLGVLAQDPHMLDPRDKTLRQQYYQNALMKGMSGTMDAAVTIFGDPTIGASKLAMVGKAKWWSKEMNAAALQSGKHIAHQDSTAYAKTKAFIQTAKNPDVVIRTMFNQHYNGDIAATLLWTVAKDEHRYENGLDLYDTTWRALYGDTDAWEQLAQDAPRIADVVGSKFANYTIGQVGKEYGLGDAAVDAQWDALRETKVAAFIDSMANGHGPFGRLGQQVGAAGLLAGQSLPRLRTTSKWRAGIHQWARPAPAVGLGQWVKRNTVSRLLPSARTGRMLDVNDINGTRVMRANLEHSRLSQDQLDYWVSAYARATSPEARFTIYNAAENASFRAHAAYYGITAKDIDKMLPYINKWRSGARQVMSTNRRFLSNDVRKEAQRRRELGRQSEADNLDQLANDMDEAVKRGDAPGHVYALPDEDGNLSLIPADADISTTAPVLISQHADVVPMVDWSVLDNALWWNTKGGFGRAVYQSKDALRSALDAAMSVWKVTAILRPGYVWRALSDEAGRVFGTLGTARSFMGAVAGAKNTAYNVSSYGRLTSEVVRAKVTRHKAAGTTDIEVPETVVDEATPMPVGPKLRLDSSARFDPNGTIADRGNERVYSSYERALADGAVGVDDFMAAVKAHGELGTLSGRLNELYHEGYTAGTKDDRVYRRHVMAVALDSVDRAVYTNPAWQQALLDTVMQARATKRVGLPGQGVIVDPFTGVSPKIKWEQVGDHFTMNKTRLLKPGEHGFEFDHVYDYIADHVDELLQPGSLLSAYQMADGRIALSVARVDKTSALNLAVKPSGGKRIKLPFFGAEGRYHRDSGSATWKIGDLRIRGAFEGQQGDLLRRQASSRGVEESATEFLANIEHARLMAKSGRWVDISPSDREAYRIAWERAVNLQLANDPVARQFLAGKSADDVIAWMHNTPAGRAYNARMGPWRSRYAEQVQIVQAMVDQYVPLNPDRLAESKALRRAALRGQAKVGDLERVTPLDDMANVHGASIEYALQKGGAGWMDWIRNSVDKTFKVLADMPADKLVRYPFASQRYRMHVENLVQARGVELRKRGDSFTQADLDTIEQEARARALRDVHKYLYESAAALDLAKAFRLIVPFGSAIGDSTTKWGIVLREHPSVAINLWKLWQAPDRAGLIQDEDGNQLKVIDGKEVWYQAATGERLPDHHPKQKMIVFRLPSWLGPEYAKGMQPVVHINKNAFRTFLDVPTAGPLVSIAANQFSLSHPEFADNGFVRAWILPFGPSADWKQVGIPGNVRNLWERFKGEDAEEAQGQAQSILMTEMVRYALGERTTPPSVQEARSRAAALRNLRFWWRFGGVSGQFVSPFQPYVDYYHMLRVQDPENADERFYDEKGPEYFALTAAVTRNTLGLPATVGAFNQYRKFKDLMDQFPKLAPLIAGAEGAGAFAQAVYEGQKNTPVRFGSGEKMRGRLTLDESWADMQRRLGWVEYGKFMDAVHADMAQLGVDSLEQKAAAPIKEAKRRWIDAHMFVENPYGGTVVSPWYQDYATFDTSAMTAKLHAMRQIVQDPRLQGRDDIRGLIDYLHVRQQFKDYMAEAGYKTLDSKKATSLRFAWHSTVFALKNQNLSFAALYDRWLSNDESLEAV